MFAALQHHAVEALSFATALLATVTVALLGWGPQIPVEQRPIEGTEHQRR